MIHCGTCKFAMPTKEIGSRVCFGQPPQVVVIPQQTPAGVQFVPQNIRPGVTVNEPACAVYKAGIFGADDLVIDGESTDIT